MRTTGLLLAVVAAAIAVVLAGCASIVSGSTQTVDIASRPDQATVRIMDHSNNEVWNGMTPTTVTLKRGAGFFRGATYRLEISKPGYEPQSVSLSSTLNGGWYIAGNFFIGGLIGWLVVDPATGGMWTLRPDSVNVTLPQKTAGAGSQLALQVALREDIDDEIFRRLDPVKVR